MKICHLAEHPVIIRNINWKTGSVAISLVKGLSNIAAALNPSLIFSSHSGSVRDVVVDELTPLHKHQCVLVTFPGIVGISLDWHWTKVSLDYPLSECALNH